MCRMPTSNGTASFTFKVNDGTTDSNTATISITVNAVNDAPVANAGTLTTDEDTPATGNLVATDVDSGSLTYSIVDQTGANGTVTITNPATGAYSYVPNANFNGTATFTFKANDGLLDSNVATITITVNAVNDPATITGTNTGSVTEDAVDNTESGTLTVSDPDAGENVFQTPGTLTGTYGDFTFNPNTGFWSYTLDNNRPATNALIAGQQVTDVLTVTSLDGTATANITVTIHGADDAYFGTESDDTFEITQLTGGSVEVRLNGNLIATTTSNPVFIDGLGGNDTVIIYGSVNSDTIVNNVASISLNGRTISPTSVETRTLNGLGGNDTITAVGWERIRMWMVEPMMTPFP